MKSAWSRGQIAKWKDEQGFGFVQPDDGGREVFLHISSLKNSPKHPTRRPKEGDSVYYQVVTQDGKLRAHNVLFAAVNKQSVSHKTRLSSSASSPSKSKPSPIKGSPIRASPIKSSADKPHSRKLPKSPPITPPLSKTSPKKNPLALYAQSAWQQPEVILISVMPLAGAFGFSLKTGNPLPLIIYPVMSCFTFVLYSDDKSRAKKGDWRISENTLHLCELAGGWIGGLVAQRKLRHKSSKQSYQRVFWGIVVTHYLLWTLWFVVSIKAQV